MQGDALRLIALPAVLLLIAASLQDESVSLAFKYARGDREITRVELEMTMDVETSAEGSTFVHKQSGPMHFNIQLDCTAAGASDFSFDLSFTDLEAKHKMDMNGTPMTVVFKGKHVRVENEEGTALIDTEKDINADSAAKILKEMEWFHQVMPVSFDTRGLPKGDIARLKKMLGTGAGEGLYPLILPDKKVKIGDEWSHKSKFDELGKFKLAKPIEVPVTFRLEKIEEGQVAVIASKVDFTAKDLECEGRIEDVPGTSKPALKQLKIATRTENRFSIKAGKFLSSRLESNVTAEMDIRTEPSEALIGSIVKVTLAGKMVSKK